MKCYTKLLILLLVNTLAECDGSHFNATAFAEAPPLYALDEWSQCQRAEDVYCIVHAALTPANSPLYDLLQEYSADTQKHYNRTLVHRGICVSRCGGQGPDTWHDAAQLCVNQNLARYDLQAEVLSVEWCNKPIPKLSASAFAFNIVLLILLGATFLTTGLHVLGKYCGRFQENRYILAFSIKNNWKILTHIRSNPKEEDRTRDLSSLEGIRFLGTLGVISTHVTIVYIYSFIDNPEFIESMFDHIPTQVAFNSPIWMQVFFSISGFLTAYFTLIYSEKRSLTFGKCLLSVINRFMRLTPVAMAGLWFTIAFPRLGTGPQWQLLVERESHHCSERWWYHLLYVHNHLTLGKFCMGHTWYLAVDMQLHILGSILLLIFVKWRKAVAPVISVLVTFSIVASGLIVYFYNLSPIITAQNPEVVSNMFKDSNLMTKLYLPVWTNLSGYLFGFAVAFIYYNNQEKGFMLNEVKWFNILFHTTLTLALVVTLAGVAFLMDTKPSRWAAIVYGSLDRTLIALCFNVFLLGCFSNCKSVVRDALSWRGFHTLGRLSYCVFIVHFIVMRMSVASNTQIGHISFYSLISLLIVSSVLSYVVAIPVYLLIESPFIQLWKALLGGNKKKEDSKQQPTKLTVIKTRSKRNDINEV
ncbi:nose resistant to fluoxetine protein 6 [Bicyclus anynana]|uniref:Nose resistant to fluoxetine protein 6 n=1 Tax=Bicyclus anynana TaxID=110368 RepID=A0A6J1N1A6_BICAN|nr:nose resistant to fluoxetine protein 6 [Bicyclus anynana]